jgi:hypothetical protein
MVDLPPPRQMSGRGEGDGAQPRYGGGNEYGADDST